MMGAVFEQCDHPLLLASSLCLGICVADHRENPKVIIFLPFISMQIIKSTTMKQVASFVVLEPDTEDRNGDTISAEEIMKTAHEFFVYKDQKRINTNHKSGTTRLDVVYVGSWIAPVDIPVEDEVIKAGSWIVDMKFLSEKTWKKVLDGTITGVSMEWWATSE